MNQTELREPSMRFAVRTVNFCRRLPPEWDTRRIAGQLLDAATSVAMSYRASGRARSPREFIAKLGTVVEEADESVGWYELIHRLEMASGEELAWLRGEAEELLAIFSASQLTARENYKRRLEEEHRQRRRGRQSQRLPRSEE